MFGKLLAIKGSVILNHIIELLSFDLVIHMFGMHASFDSMSIMRGPTELRCVICMIWRLTSMFCVLQPDLDTIINCNWHPHMETFVIAGSWDKAFVSVKTTVFILMGTFHEAYSRS